MDGSKPSRTAADPERFDRFPRELDRFPLEFKTLASLAFAAITGRKEARPFPLALLALRSSPLSSLLGTTQGSRGREAWWCWWARADSTEPPTPAIAWAHIARERERAAALLHAWLALPACLSACLILQKGGGGQTQKTLFFFIVSSPLYLPPSSSLDLPPGEWW